MNNWIFKYTNIYEYLCVTGSIQADTTAPSWFAMWPHTHIFKYTNIFEYLYDTGMRPLTEYLSILTYMNIYTIQAAFKELPQPPRGLLCDYILNIFTTFIEGTTDPRKIAAQV